MESELIDIGPNLAALIAGFLNVLFKVAVLYAASKTIWLGYDLLMKGVKGEFSFKAELPAGYTDLRSASPGLLFVLLGTVMIVVALSTSYNQEAVSSEKTQVKPPIVEPLAVKEKHLDTNYVFGE